MEHVKSTYDYGYDYEYDHEYENHPADRDLLMDVSDRLDNFFERKLFRFLCVAVPIYFGAHLINYLINR